MSDELKACPFCGKDGCYVDKEGLAAGEGKTTPDIACAHTSCMPPSSYVPAKSWQSRPIEDALRGEVASLTAELKAAREALADCRDAARGHWRDEWNEKYFSRIEAVNNIACEALEASE